MDAPDASGEAAQRAAFRLLSVFTFLLGASILPS